LHPHRVPYRYAGQKILGRPSWNQPPTRNASSLVEPLSFTRAASPMNTGTPSTVVGIPRAIVPRTGLAVGEGGVGLTGAWLGAGVMVIVAVGAVSVGVTGLQPVARSAIVKTNHCRRIFTTHSTFGNITWSRARREDATHPIETAPTGRRDGPPNQGFDLWVDCQSAVARLPLTAADDDFRADASFHVADNIHDGELAVAPFNAMPGRPDDEVPFGARLEPQALIYEHERAARLRQEPGARAVGFDREERELARDLHAHGVASDHHQCDEKARPESATSQLLYLSNIGHIPQSASVNVTCEDALSDSRSRREAMSRGTPCRQRTFGPRPSPCSVR